MKRDPIPLGPEMQVPVTRQSLAAKLAPVPELLAIAKRVVWFQDPAVTLADPALFLGHLMTYTLVADVVAVLRFISNDDIAFALDHAPAGVFDKTSWSFWNSRIGRTPIPAMPKRIIADQAAD